MHIQQIRHLLLSFALNLICNDARCKNLFYYQGFKQLICFYFISPYFKNNENSTHLQLQQAGVFVSLCGFSFKTPIVVPPIVFTLC